MKYILILVAVVVSTTCFAATPPETMRIRDGDFIRTVDRFTYSTVFEGCLDKAKGPQSTHYNDWDEAIEACQKAAREIATIKTEHKPVICNAFASACTVPE